MKLSLILFLYSQCFGVYAGTQTAFEMTSVDNKKYSHGLKVSPNGNAIIIEYEYHLGDKKLASKKIKYTQSFYKKILKNMKVKDPLSLELKGTKGKCMRSFRRWVIQKSGVTSQFCKAKDTDLDFLKFFNRMNYLIKDYPNTSI